MKKPVNNLKPRHIFRTIRDDVADPKGKTVSDQALKFLGINTGIVKTCKVFSVFRTLDENQWQSFANNGLKDHLIHQISFDTPLKPEFASSFILVSKLPGITDDEGRSAQTVLDDLTRSVSKNTLEQFIFCHDLFWFEAKLSNDILRRLSTELLGNPLINHFELGTGIPSLEFNSRVKLHEGKSYESIPLPEDSAQLIDLSKNLLLSLNLEEMRAVAAYFKKPETVSRRSDRKLPADPTDCEIEILAQTWSEHCKHKEFSATIAYRDLDTNKDQVIHSLFDTYIKGATRKIQESGRAPWLVKVFSDNAGAVKIDESRLFIWKVETHNSPSALDPYGGALTGIVGNNRDPLGTGRGGARLLFNTNVLCFASPDYSGDLFPGQLHPRKIVHGVCHGIEDGGNKSGVPTINGSVIFDERYRGKPLVYCGTGAVMASYYNGKPSWEKPISPGDLIVMSGGRVGKDGIHGATFSSLEIDESSPQSAVQIGSPITQKMMSGFLEHACQIGLVKSCTDNGAGGLSSSVGELAGICGGACVELESVPLKYPGLKPWEIFLSESQERMTLVVEKANWKALQLLAQHHEVEVSVIGTFTDSGELEVRHHGETIALLDMSFLHDGVPKKFMTAEWQSPILHEPNLPAVLDCSEILLRLMASPNICSREAIIRRYDHEVKGCSVVKPLMGASGTCPQDAAVMRFDFDSFAGVAVSNGIIPRYGDLNAYEMSAGSFDEAVRQIIAVGGFLPGDSDGENLFWSVNDNFCVPDSAFDPVSNPDGKYKLAQLVKMCQALYDMSVFFGIPMTSGKDSMRNDFRSGSVKISVPPTILYSMTAMIPDVRKVMTSDFKAPGDLVYLLGTTFDELGGSEFLRLFDQLGAVVPKVRREDAMHLYRKVSRVISLGMIESCHDLSDGGLAVALVESTFGAKRGLEISIPDSGLSCHAFLFSESHSRFVVSVRPENKQHFEEIFLGDFTFLGKITETPQVLIRRNTEILVDLPQEKLHCAWRKGLDLG